MKRIICLIALAVALAFAGSANAATTNQYMTIDTTVVTSCVLNVPNINFGNYSGSTIYASGNVYVTCTSGAPYVITMDAGQNAAGGSRHLAYGANRLLYTLYDPNWSQWGDTGYGGTFPVSTGYGGTATGSQETISVNAYLWGGAIVPAGYYSDWVNVIVNF